jgi:hypothetical protein
MEKYGEWEERLEIFHLQEREGVRLPVEKIEGGPISSLREKIREENREVVVESIPALKNWPTLQEIIVLTLCIQPTTQILPPLFKSIPVSKELN